jgi:K+-sensing histidine kinase KdpD
VPGSARSKRWQDVETIRDAGVDVIATLNIQHLESLNHVVEGITGIKVRETIPDKMLTAATVVQLVDLPVEGLVERLEAGKVYPPERAAGAAELFSTRQPECAARAGAPANRCRSRRSARTLHARRGDCRDLAGRRSGGGIDR